jgi:hypothetical protein
MKDRYYIRVTFNTWDHKNQKQVVLEEVMMSGVGTQREVEARIRRTAVECMYKKYPQHKVHAGLWSQFVSIEKESPDGKKCTVLQTEAVRRPTETAPAAKVPPVKAPTKPRKQEMRIDFVCEKITKLGEPQFLDTDEDWYTYPNM